MAENRDSDHSHEIRYETFMPGGPGGQHANKTASAVRAVHVPTGISAIARDSRSQHRNRQLAKERVLAKLRARHRPVKPRLPTLPSLSSAARRRQSKAKRAQLKDLRRKVSREED